jgi:hypothetical protein
LASFFDVKADQNLDWNYCESAQQLLSTIKTADGWTSIQWKRAIETIGKENFPEMVGTGIWYETTLRH